MNKNLTFAAAKIQTTFGTAIAITPASDYLQVSECEIEPNQLMDKVKILSGKFTTEPSVVSNLNVTVKGKIPLVSGGLEAAPPCGPLLEAAGFIATVDTAPTDGSKFIYTRSLTTKDLSMNHYSMKGSNAIIKAANSIIMNSIKIAIESGKVPMLDFSGVGLAGGASALAFLTTGAVTAPTQTKNIYYCVNDVSATLLDTSYELVKADIDIVNKVTQKPVMTGFGFGYGEIRDEESKFNCSTLLDTSMTLQPLNRIRSSVTPGTFTMTFGSIAKQKVSISTTKAQLISCKDSMQGDLLSSDISGEYIDNEIVITFNSDIT